MEQKYFRNKITFLNLVMTVLIVILHAQSPERFGLPLNWDFPFIYSISMLCRIATPMFFFVSALLFFKGCDFNDLERKFKSRIKSLLIPYIVWNVIFVFIFFVLSHTPYLASKMNITEILNSPKEIIRAILNSYHSDLWFVRNLMFYTLLAPVILLLFKKKRNAIIVLLVSFCIAIIAEPEYKSLLRWFPVYLNGAVLGYFNNCMSFQLYEERMSRFRIISMLLVFIIIYIYTLWSGSDLMITYTSPLLIWSLVDGLFSRHIASLIEKRWMHYTFFIFCSHHFVLNVLQKLVVLTCAPTQLVINLTFIISPFVAIIILSLTAKFLSRYKIYSYLSGGR